MCYFVNELQLFANFIVRPIAIYREKLLIQSKKSRLINLPKFCVTCTDVPRYDVRFVYFCVSRLKVSVLVSSAVDRWFESMLVVANQKL